MAKMYKYRYKTETELEKEFGRYWDEECDMNDDGHMNYLLGIEVVPPENVIDENGDVFKSFNVFNECPDYDGHRLWSITPKLIKKIDFTPNYKPKEFIRG